MAGETRTPARPDVRRNEGTSRSWVGATVEALAAPTGVAAALANLPLALGLLSTSIIIAALYFGRGILVPLALAFFLSFVLNPLVVRLKRLGLPRRVSVVVVVVLALAALGGAGFLLGQQVRTLSAELPVFQENIQDKLRNFREKLAGPSIFEGAVTTMETVQKEVEAEADAEPKQAKREPDPMQVELKEAPVPPIAKLGKWLGAIGGPLADAAIVLVFLIVVLLDRQGMRDRMLRLLGGNLHRTTDAMDEAGTRIGKYLTMQLVVNASYGLPMAVGLWFIGVPGAVLWGALAAVMRFVPYVGPMISALFPLALAFAVDPGWNMVLWTLGLIVFLEVVSNNIVEPWLYGASTGLSMMSLMVSATFWTLVWGPIGLVMSTPMTVCLLVIGRHLPQLRFFDVLLGSEPVLDPATRVYQRLLAGDPEDAIELSLGHVASGGVSGFYETVGIPALRIASSDHDSVATAEHRLRVVTGIDRLIDELALQYTGTIIAGRPLVVCLGAKWEMDMLAARMVAHGLTESGIPANAQVADNNAAGFVASLDLVGAHTVCISHFSPEPHTRIRYLCRHLRRRWPDLHIVAALWNAPPDLLDEAGAKSLGVDAIATSFEEVMSRVRHQLGAQLPEKYLIAPISADDVERVRALRASGALDDSARRGMDLAAKRAAEVFDVSVGLVTLIDEMSPQISGASVAPQTPSDKPAASAGALPPPGELSMCGHVVASGHSLVVPDIARDPRFASNPALVAKGVRFYAGAPLCDAERHIYGSLCIMDLKPRSFTAQDLRLLQSMANDLRNLLNPVSNTEPKVPESLSDPQLPSATVAQPAPA